MQLRSFMKTYEFRFSLLLKNYTFSIRYNIMHYFSVSVTNITKLFYNTTYNNVNNALNFITYAF